MVGIVLMDVTLRYSLQKLIPRLNDTMFMTCPRSTFAPLACGRGGGVRSVCYVTLSLLPIVRA